MRTSISEQALAKTSWPLIHRDGLGILQSPLLSGEESLLHAFTTRIGGKSLPPLDSFNLGKHMSDEASRQDAIANRQSLCRSFGASYENLMVPMQVHSTNVVRAERNALMENCDAVACDSPVFPVLLHYADCVPIVLYDRKERVFCVIHAGWKGTALGMAPSAVHYLEKHMGSEAKNMIAAIGPAIGSCCYPTGDEVAASLSQSVSSIDGLIIYKDGKPHPDLKAINAMQLIEHGVEKIDINDSCTACLPNLFYSHRKFSGLTGRQGAFACLVASGI